MGQNWAIAIGINQYNNLPPLKYAVRDAELMRDWLEREAGFDQVYLFTDNSPPITDARKPFASQPTYATLRRFLRVRFNQAFLSAGDNLWFFFSGHGLRHAERDYLIPSDADPYPDELENTAIALSYVTERLRRCGADNVVLLLDACRNEEGSKGLGVGEEKQQGVITIASCSPSERSYEIEGLQQGSFTYNLLQGLRIQGEGNCATLERLDRYLRYQVPEVNRYYHKPRQTPYAIAEPASKYHLILLPRQATLQDIATLKLDAQEAELEGDLKLAEQLWIRILAVSPSDPQVLRALKRIWTQPRQPVEQLTSPIIDDRGAKSEETKVLKDSPASFQDKSESGDKLGFEFDVITVNRQGQEIKREKGQAEYFREDLGNNVTLEMVSISAGKFLMGTEEKEIERLVKNFDWEYFRREKPQHEVTVKSFFMGKYPITQAQWRAVATLPKVKRDLKRDPSDFKGDNRPVEQVSWYDAVEFCQRLSKKTGREYRLPSEAEWEYACRAGTTTPFHFGETITSELANYHATYTYAIEPQGEYREETTPVGSFPPNGFGLYDMHGNVWEWCADNWHDDYKGAPTDGSAWTTGGDSLSVVLRGGSWINYPLLCRSAYRYGDLRGRDVIVNYVGFRVVCVAGWTF